MTDSAHCQEPQNDAPAAIPAATPYAHQAVVDQIVAEAPPLSEDQACRLSLLLAPASDFQESATADGSK